MKKIIQIFILILFSSIAHAQIKDEGPKAYFGYLGLDSIKRTDLLKYDTLKMDNPALKIIKFSIAVSTYDCEECTTDVTFWEIGGNAISECKMNPDLFKKKLNQKLWLTVQDIEFINSKGKLIKYPKEFSFKLYE
jgi:hypothetical protein